MTPTPSTSLKWTPNWPLLVLAALLLPLLVTLGVWQLNRAAEKQAIEAALNERQASAPIEFNKQEALAAYTRIIARGEFDNSRIWLVDNRQREGRPGYEVVQPFMLADGNTVLVNRGWVPAPPTRDELPSVELMAGPQTLFAAVAARSHHPMLSAEASNAGWPKIITQIDPALMLRADNSAAGFTLNIDAASAGALRTEWQAVNMSASKHTGYAVQWFAMALALVILSLVANTNIATWWRHRKSH